MEQPQPSGYLMGQLERILGNKGKPRTRAFMSTSRLSSYIPHRDIAGPYVRVYMPEGVVIWHEAITERDELVARGELARTSSLTKGDHVIRRADEFKKMYRKAQREGWVFDLPEGIRL
jgi:hypothetical protein